jgi:hypothetical protein
VFMLTPEFLAHSLRYWRFSSDRRTVSGCMHPCYYEGLYRLPVVKNLGLVPAARFPTVPLARSIS